MFILDQNIELWEIIKNDPKVLMKKDADDNDVSKSKAEYTQAYLKAISKNFQK